jgi:uncharacterized membrane protein YcaP (DUF421 family)
LNEALVVCVRGIISFFTLLIFTRVLGKQQMGQITFFDYIIGITIGSFAASLTVDLSSAAWPHWIGILIWVVLGVLMQKISLKYLTVSQYINDEPIIVVINGKVIAEKLKITKYTFNELLEEFRCRGIFDIDEIKFGIIEANGKLSFILNERYKIIVDKLQMGEDDRIIDNELIFSGIIISENLTKLNRDEEWLSRQLKNKGLDNASEVLFAYLNSSQQLMVSSYHDKIISDRNIFRG